MYLSFHTCYRLLLGANCLKSGFPWAPCADRCPRTYFRLWYQKFNQGGGLEAGPHVGRVACDGGTEAGDWGSSAATRARAPFRPRRAVCVGGIRCDLTQHGMVPSMSRPANPYDNASCESFFKTLKREEIYATEYADLDDLREHIEEFIERYYNQKRLHSALGYCSPEEFEHKTDRVAAASSATVRFFARTDEKSSTGLLGEGTQAPSLPPDPIPAGESAR